MINVPHCITEVSKARTKIITLSQELESNKKTISLFMDELERWFDKERDGVPTVVKCDGKYLLVYRGDSGNIEITEADIINA